MNAFTAEYTVDLPADEAADIARLLEQTAGHLAIRAHWHGCGRANLDEWLNGHRPDREPSFVRELLARADRNPGAPARRVARPSPRHRRRGTRGHVGRLSDPRSRPFTEGTDLVRNHGFAARLAVGTVQATSGGSDTELGARGAETVGSKARVSELVESWVDQRLRRGEIEPLTGDSQRYNLRMFARQIGDPLAGELTSEHVQLWREKAIIESGPRAGRRLAPSTMRTRLGTLRMFCEWLVTEGIIEQLPTAGVKPPREPRRRPRGLTARQVALLLGTVPDSRARLICLLAVQEMLRRVEVHRLDVGDIDLDERTVFVVGKGSHERVVPLSDETSGALDVYLTEWPATAGPLIRSYHDGVTRLSIGHIGHLMTDWFREADVQKAPWDGRSMHALRHTGATDLANRGEDIRAIQQGLGHASLRATQVYTGMVRLGALRRAMGGRRYSGALAGAGDERKGAR